MAYFFRTTVFLIHGQKCMKLRCMKIILGTLKPLTLLTPLLFPCFAFCCITDDNPIPTASLKLITEDYPPYNYAENGDIKGLNTGILKEICVRLSMQCHFSIMAWSRGFGLAQKHSDSAVYSTSRTPAREPLFQWVGPLETGRLGIYKLKKRDDIDINSHKPIHQYSIGIIRGAVTKGTLLSNGWDDDLNLVEFSTMVDFFTPFFSGRLDLIPGSDLSLRYAFKKHGFDFNAVERIYDFGPDEAGNYLAVNLGTDPRTIEAMNAELLKLRKEGWIAKRRLDYIQLNQ